MKKQTFKLSVKPLVAIRQIALSLYSAELTVQSLSRAVLCHAEARALLCKRLSAEDNMLIQKELFTLKVSTDTAKNSIWPKRIFEDGFMGLFNTLDEEQKIDTLDELLSKLEDVDSVRRWYKSIELKGYNTIAEHFANINNSLSDQPEVDNLTKLVFLSENQFFKKLLHLGQAQLPIFNLTYSGQDELQLFKTLSLTVTGNPLVIIDESNLGVDDTRRLLTKTPSSALLFRFNYIGNNLEVLDHLLDYLEYGWQNNAPEGYFYTNLYEQKRHLFDDHLLIIQLICPIDFDLYRYATEDTGLQLLQYVRNQRSENIEVFGDISRLQRLLRLSGSENIFIWHQSSTEKLMQHASDMASSLAEIILGKKISKELNENVYHRIGILAMLSISATSSDRLKKGIGDILYEWLKLIPNENKRLTGLDVCQKEKALILALDNDEEAIRLINQNRRNTKKLLFSYTYDLKSQKIKAFLKGSQRSGVQGDQQYLMTSNGLTFDQVFGLDEAKWRLQMIVDYFQQAEKFKRLGVKPPMRLVLSGPPGCGKTMIAKAFATHINIPYYSISAAEITSQKYAGWGAGLLRNVFENARKTAPCIIFLDELDAFGNRASYSSDSVGFDARSIMNTLLVLLDGIGTDENIVVIAATNRIEDLDNALLRPKRFGTIVQIEALNLQQKENLIRNCLPESQCSGDYNQIVDYLIARTSGDISPAKIEDIVAEVKLRALLKDTDAITYSDLIETIDDLLLGKKKHRISEEHKISKAFHEAAFAVLHKTFFPDIAIERISVQYRTDGFGGTFLNNQIQDQTVFYTDEELIALMITHLGAPLAEKKHLGKYSVSSSSGFAVAAKISILLAGNLDFDKGLDHSIQYALYEIDSVSDQFKDDLNRLSRKIIETAAAYANEKLDDFWDVISELANQLIKLENLDKTTIENITSKIEKRDITYSDFLRRFKSGWGTIGFHKS